MTINTLPTAPTRSMAAAEFVDAANAFLAALPTFSTQVNADLSALLTLSQLVSTSTTSLLIGTGSKSLTVQTAKAYLAGQTVRIYSTATPDNYMDGTVTSYNSGTGALVVNVTSVGGSGTLAAWTVVLNGGLALINGSASQVFSVAPATAAAHAAQAAQIQSGALVNISAALTGTEYAATPSPAITAYAAGQRFMVTFDLACPPAPTLKLNGIATPPSLVRQNLDGSYETLTGNDFPAGWTAAVVLVSATQARVENLPRRTRILPFTRDLAAATGNVEYTGFGATPGLVRLRGTINGTVISSDGVAFVGNQTCTYTTYAAVSNTTGYLGAWVTSAGNLQTVTVDSFAKGSVTLAWLKTLSPTGTVAFSLEVEY